MSQVLTWDRMSPQLRKVAERVETRIGVSEGAYLWIVRGFFRLGPARSARRCLRRAGWWKSPRPDLGGPRSGNRPGLLDDPTPISDPLEVSVHLGLADS